MAKLGQLYLQGGRWEGRQLLSQAYVNAATTQQIATADGRGYGYLWWVRRTVDGQSAFAALGYGGQAIYVVPTCRLVVAMTSDLDGAHLENVALIESTIAPSFGGSVELPNH